MWRACVCLRQRPRPGARRIRLLLAVALACGPLYARARLGDGATVLTNRTFEAFVHRHKRALVDFFNPRDENWPADQGHLDEAVRKVRGLGCKVPVGKVDVIAQADLAARFVPAGKFPQLLWFLHGEPTQYHRTLRTAKHVSDFVLALDRDPIVVVQNQSEVSNFNRAVFCQTQRSSPLYKVIEVVAARHLDTVAFAFRENSEDDITYVSDEAEPMSYRGELTANALEAWVRGLLVKSEAPPEVEAAPGEAVVVVGKTFEKMVLRKDKDVLILVYAPWCGHSRKVFPSWEVLARSVQHVPHLVVAKIDGDRNSSPLPDLFSWEAYPTIFFVKAGNRTPVVFHGNRTVANFVRFASEHTSIPFSVDESVMQEDAEALSEL